jgi:hypothetical protein
VSQLDAYLKSLLNKAKAKFSNIALLVVAVEDAEDDEESPEITLMTNMGQKEVEYVAGSLVGSEFGAPDGVSLH